MFSALPGKILSENEKLCNQASDYKSWVIFFFYYCNISENKNSIQTDIITPSVIKQFCQEC